MERTLNDERRYRIVKVFNEAAELDLKLRDLGWTARVETTGEFFLYGQASYQLDR